MDAFSPPSTFLTIPFFFIIIRWKLNYTEVAPSRVSSIVLRISLPQFNFYSHAANDEKRESKWCKRGLFRRDKWRDGKLCVEMVVSEKLIGGLAVSVSLLPRDLSPLSFLPSLFSPFLFRLCHSTPGLSGSRAGTEGWAEKLERRERSKRREKERRKSGEDRLYSIPPRPPGLPVVLLAPLSRQLWKFN